ncbi:MAG TPA: 5'-methylthioadenosine/S-adenosylhomocysteine nucleosidase [Thermomicrobiales bacterium]|nr:5'-methylthioadenosine/S-adenosylhomocysteine nucleosidase [Thermomicrobiales bacterium]
MIPAIDRLAVIVAMPSELQHLPGLPHVPEYGDTLWPSVAWQQGALEIVAVLSGIGMIRAAAATEATIDQQRPDAVLNFGCTGAHQADVHVGDVIMSTRSVAHATMVIEPGGMARFDLHDGMEAPPPGATGLPSDPSLLSIARAAAEGWMPDPWVAATGHNAHPQVLEGVVASADVWTQAPEAISALVDRHQSLCEDMEAAAIATICSLHGVPFLTIKDISNNELQQATIFDPGMAHLPEGEVGRRAAALTGRLIERIVSAES